MKKTLHTSKWLIIIVAIFYLNGCASSIDLIQDEIQVFVGQSLNARSFLATDFRSNDDV